MQEAIPMTGTTSKFPFAVTQDQRIHDDVRRQITWHPDIESKHIAIVVRDSTVFLTGSVLTCLERREAEKAAEASLDVARVINLLRVDPRCHRSDDDIVADVRASLLLSTSMWDEELVCEVLNGAVTLRGTVHWGFERQRAEDMTLAILGVTSVKNLIEIKAVSHGKFPVLAYPQRKALRPLEAELQTAC